MNLNKRICLIIILMIFLSSSVFNDEKVDPSVMSRIRTEGFRNSEIMELTSYMTEVYGPRMAGTKAYFEASKWAEKKFREFGLRNVRVEPWGKIGLRWENTFTSIHMITPQYQPVIGYSVPWTRGTKGVVKAEAFYLNSDEIYSAKDLEKFKGRVKDRVVCIKPERILKPNFKPLAVRLSKEELDGMAELKIPAQRKTEIEKKGKYEKASADKNEKKPLEMVKILEFLKKEGAVAAVTPGRIIADGPMDKGVVLVNDGDPVRKGELKPITSMIFAAEHYNRILRVLKKGIDVVLQIRIDNKFSKENVDDYNVLAEIPGGDLKDEIVMLGGHYDGKSAGTGATDNASGSAIVMEAVRILKKIGFKPRRTIMVALWGAEEWGHHGSRSFVKKYLFDPDTKKKKKMYDRFSVYFNVDWYGKFRGIYLQGNDLVRPVFSKWMEPFHDIGMTYLVPGNTGGTDHMAFYKAGLPAFQFIQDDLEFFTTTFHTNMDVYDRLVADDLKQAAVVLAGFVYNAAMREEKIPRDGFQNSDRRWHK